jgi:predicted secreted hydrolase
MLYTMRKKDGTIDPNSSGTVVSADGGSRHLTSGSYKVKSTGNWRSPASGATYPMGWTIDVPSLQTSLKIDPQMFNQELDKKRSSDVSYWEGACNVRGTKAGKPIAGKAYVEMTGYAGAFNAGI